MEKKTFKLTLTLWGILFGLAALCVGVACLIGPSLQVAIAQSDPDSARQITRRNLQRVSGTLGARGLDSSSEAFALQEIEERFPGGVERSDSPLVSKEAAR